MNGEQKLKRVKLTPNMLTLDDIGQLERWIEDCCFKEAIAKAAGGAEKMQPMMGALGNLGYKRGLLRRLWMT